MTNENQKNENEQEQKQPSTPVAQVELTDEQLEQVVGGFEPNSPTAYPPGPTAPGAADYPPGPGIIAVL